MLLGLVRRPSLLAKLPEMTVFVAPVSGTALCLTEKQELPKNLIFKVNLGVASGTCPLT